MRILVQKFGGTSLATADLREKAVARIKEALQRGYTPVVVVSAMGRYGAPYATDTLLAVAREVCTEINPREQDLLLSCGELISTVIMVQALKLHHVEARAFTGGTAGIITDSNFGDAHIIEVNPEKVLACLQQKQVAVVAGFQGKTQEGEVTTLGRGGSDTTAAALGVALAAEAVEIYTDVNGVMTTDPHLVPEAKLLKVMTYEELCEMAHLGAKVIHPRAVEIAMRGRVPLKIRSVHSDQEGTLISDRDPARPGLELKSDRMVTGLTHIPDLAQFDLACLENANSSGKTLEVFNRLAEARISVDMIQVTPEQITFTVQESLFDQTFSVLEQTGLPFKAAKGFAKVAIVGAGIRGVPGVMARVVEGLYKAQVPLFQTADSHTNIACLVKKEDMITALRALHEEFGLDD
ncbi:MAG TPA: aspartate kinase [Hydrogenispora sp.]|nr:aspartate kinase [Hydrogenispora sp.]